MPSQITLTLDDDGRLQCQISGDAQASKVVALGLLEMGKSLVLAPSKQAGGENQKPRLQLALPNGPLPPINGDRHHG